MNISLRGDFSLSFRGLILSISFQTDKVLDGTIANLEKTLAVGFFINDIGKQGHFTKLPISVHLMN